VVVLLDVDPRVAAGRLDAAPDRLELAGDDFHRRVGGGYRALAAAAPSRWIVVDGSGTVDEVATRVRAAVEASLARESRRVRSELR